MGWEYTPRGIYISAGTRPDPRSMSRKTTAADASEARGTITGAPPNGDRLAGKRNLPMTQSRRKVLCVVALFLLVEVPLVHWLRSERPALAQPAKPKSDSTKKQQPPAAPPPKIRYGTEGLPTPVQDMREAIINA